MSTIFKNKEQVLWIHHETFTPALKTSFEIDGNMLTVKSVKLKVALEGDGPASVKQLTSIVELV